MSSSDGTQNACQNWDYLRYCHLDVRRFREQSGSSAETAALPDGLQTTQPSQFETHRHRSAKGRRSGR